jgi:hypothetical protein
MLQVIRWGGGDDINHYPLCMSPDDVIALDIRLYAFSKCRLTERIFVKFVVEVMPLETTPSSYVLICYTL